MDTRDLYLDLMKRNLTNTIFIEKGNSDELLDTKLRGTLIRAAWGRVRSVLKRLQKPGDLKTQLEHRKEGISWPRTAETMVGHKRLDNIRALIEDIVEQGIEGDLIETGVWRGGSTIFMRAILKSLEVTDKTVWVADSFQGLPKPDAKYPADDGDTFHIFGFLAVSVDEVKKNFERYHLLDDQVRFLEGFFEDTLPDCPVEKLSLMRLDGDMYSSTIVALESLYPKLSKGGYVIVDDYYAVSACKEAVDDYRKTHQIQSKIVEVDRCACYWQK